MPRLVDAEELIEVAHRARLDSRERIEQMIESAPTVDAVPVVRCKDCFICETRQTANYLPFLYCELHDCSVLGDFYCSWAERRTDE